MSDESSIIALIHLTNDVTPIPSISLLSQFWHLIPAKDDERRLLRNDDKSKTHFKIFPFLDLSLFFFVNIDNIQLTSCHEILINSFASQNGRSNLLS